MINIPVFMDAQNLQPFIDEGLRDVISKVQYIDFNGGYNGFEDRKNHLAKLKSWV